MDTKEQNIMKEYLIFLALQYKEATNDYLGTITSKQFYKELCDWYASRESMIENYIETLSYMGLDEIDLNTTYEVGKGVLDSITPSSDIKIITPYHIGFNKLGKKNDNILPYYFAVNYNGDPLLYERNNAMFSTGNIIHLPSIDKPYTFITENPYVKENAKCWVDIHNSGKNNIVMGMYGSIYDKDIKDKIKFLRDLESKLILPYSKEETTFNDNYICVLKTDSKTKRRVK